MYLLFFLLLCIQAKNLDRLILEELRLHLSTQKLSHALFPQGPRGPENLRVKQCRRFSAGECDEGYTVAFAVDFIIRHLIQTNYDYPVGPPPAQTIMQPKLGHICPSIAGVYQRIQLQLQSIFNASDCPSHMIGMTGPMRIFYLPLTP